MREQSVSEPTDEARSLRVPSADPLEEGTALDVPAYRRVLLKVSGDAFSPPDRSYGISPEATGLLARQLQEVGRLGVEVAVVVGGGNIWRGRDAPGIDRSRADYMGMLATVMNALALQAALEKLGGVTRVQTAIHMAQSAAPTGSRASATRSS